VIFTLWNKPTTQLKKRIVKCPIQTTLASPEQIILVSDESVIQERATWSFMIADRNRKMIAEKLQK
jgi:hypothetical protein